MAQLGFHALLEINCALELKQILLQAASYQAANPSAVLPPPIVAFLKARIALHEANAVQAIAAGGV